jgi:ubiquinone/menaquinone biosynthesis C-methylase UbiE
MTLVQIAPALNLLIVDSDASRLVKYSKALPQSWKVVTTPSASGAYNALANQDFDAMVVFGELLDGFFERVDRADISAKCLVVSVGAPAKQLVRPARRGHDFRALETVDPQRLAAFLQDAFFKRIHLRIAPDDAFRIEMLTANGREANYPLLDVSNQGMAFELGENQNLHHFLPGAHLTQVSVRNADNTVFTAAHAVVRRLTPSPNGYSVGIEFEGQLETQELVAATEILTDPVRCVALLTEALRGDTAVIRTAVASGSWVLSEGRVSLSAGRFYVEAPQGLTLELGDVVRITFDQHGSMHTFDTSVLRVTTDGKLEFKTPPTMRRQRQRGSNRFQPDDSERVVLRFQAPFQTATAQRPVLDVSAFGLSIAVDYDKDVLPPGATINSATLCFDNGHEIPVRLKVRSLTPYLNSRGFNHRCGISIESVLSGNRSAIVDAIVQTGLPGVQEAQGLSFKEMWALLHETGFLYPEKLDRLKPQMEAIKKSVTALLTKGNYIARTLLFKRGERLQAHLSVLRLYDDTWLIHHLGALPQKSSISSVARFVSLGIGEYFEQMPEMEWLRVYYRPDNAWAARIFGRFAKRIRRSPLSELEEFGYFVAPAGIERKEIDGVQVRRADQDDLYRIERYFVEHSSTLLMRADNLWRQGLKLQNLEEEYHRVGLERRRECWVAERDGVFLGFALAEISSVGLNFSELTNTFRVYGEDTSALDALIRAMAARYKDLGYSHAIGLAPKAQDEAFQALGFSKTKTYVSWTCHRSLSRQYHDWIMGIGQRQTREQIAPQQVYLMESDEEAARLERKTDDTTTREHLNLVGLQEGMKALDAGAGTGAVARQMAQMVGPSGSVVALDRSDKRMTHGAQLAEDSSVDNLEFILGDVLRPPLPKDSFDFVWSRFLFEYLAAPEAALTSLLELVKPGGKIVIGDLDGNGVFHAPMPDELQIGIDTLQKGLAHYFDPYVGRKLFPLMHSAGLRDIRVHILPYHLYAGTAPDSVIEHWKLKLETIRPFAQQVMGSESSYNSFAALFLAFLADPHTLSYSVLFLVEGHKPNSPT